MVARGRAQLIPARPTLHFGAPGPRKGKRRVAPALPGLLPGAGESEAIALCERLRSAIADSVCLTAAGPVRFTISGGVSALVCDGLDAALKRADRALYEAKNHGRDRLMRAAA